MKAFVDSREPDDVKLKCLKGSANGSFVFKDKELPQGDFYLPEHDVVVERKEASDFASSTTEGRLSEQADRMIAEHDHVFVIVEGSPLQLKYSDVSSESILGMQTSLAVKRGIKIIYTESVEDTCYAVNRIFERFADGEHESAESGYVKTADTGEVDDVQVAMLMQIDGMSAEKAKGINDNISVDKISWHVSCERGDTQGAKDSIMQVDGVGSILAQRVIDAFS